METVRIDRRRFLELGVIGGAASLLGCTTMDPGPDKGKIPVLLLSCMDYRLIQATERYMDKERGLARQYDHVILAGASLAAVSDKVKAWNTTFWEHVPIAMRLHGITRVMVLDHRACGAYNELMPGCCTDEKQELEAHAKVLRAFRTQVNQRHPTLAVELLFMELNGSVLTIT